LPVSGRSSWASSLTATSPLSASFPSYPWKTTSPCGRRFSFCFLSSFLFGFPTPFSPAFPLQRFIHRPFFFRPSCFLFLPRARCFFLFLPLFDVSALTPCPAPTRSFLGACHRPILAVFEGKASVLGLTLRVWVLIYLSSSRIIFFPCGRPAALHHRIFYRDASSTFQLAPSAAQSPSVLSCFPPVFSHLFVFVLFVFFVLDEMNCFFFSSRTRLLFSVSQCRLSCSWCFPPRFFLLSELPPSRSPPGFPALWCILGQIRATLFPPSLFRDPPCLLPVSSSQA